MSKSLHYFMRDLTKDDQVISLKGPKSFKDENGKTLKLEIRKLSHKKIEEILDKYKTQEIVYDSNNMPYVVDGEAVLRSKTDHSRAIRHLIVEALKYPNLKDKSLLDFYNCIDNTEMPLHVFANSGDYLELVDLVLGVLGLNNPADELDREIDDAKN